MLEYIMYNNILKARGAFAKTGVDLCLDIIMQDRERA